MPSQSPVNVPHQWPVQVTQSAPSNVPCSDDVVAPVQTREGRHKRVQESRHIGPGPGNFIERMHYVDRRVRHEILCHRRFERCRIRMREGRRG